MHRRGHIGIVLLAFAPIVFLLFQQRNYLLAVIGWLGVQAVEPLPDYDLRTSLLSHRKTSHSLLAALVVGSIIGASGWLLGGTVNDLLQSGPTVLAAVFDLGRDVPGSFLRAITDRVGLTAPDIENQIRALAGRSIDRSTLALVGLCVGSGGICLHLLGDVITTAGIQPFLPVSRKRISLLPLRAGSSGTNAGLFGLGVVAMLGAVVGGVL